MKWSCRVEKCCWILQANFIFVWAILIRVTAARIYLLSQNIQKLLNVQRPFMHIWTHRRLELVSVSTLSLCYHNAGLEPAGFFCRDRCCGAPHFYVFRGYFSYYLSRREAPLGNFRLFLLSGNAGRGGAGFFPGGRGGRVFDFRRLSDTAIMSLYWKLLWNTRWHSCLFFEWHILTFGRYTL